MHAKQWRVDVFVSEEGNVTRARAVLVGDSPTHLSASGTARRNPHDPAVPEIGDEVAVGRALGALSADLLGVAYQDIDASVDDFRAD
jgi:uncharacterized protein DUF1876